MLSKGYRKIQQSILSNLNPNFFLQGSFKKIEKQARPYNQQWCGFEQTFACTSANCRAEATLLIS